MWELCNYRSAIPLLTWALLLTGGDLHRIDCHGVRNCPKTNASSAQQAKSCSVVLMALIQSPHVAAIFWHLLVKHPSAILATAVDTTNSIETFPADGYSTYFTFNYLAGLLLILILSYGLYRFMFNPIIEPRESSTSKSTANPGRVAVLVLGDIGRSPRMQNHAVSFAKANWHVDLIGFRGQFLLLAAHGRCRIVYRCHRFEGRDSHTLLTFDSQIPHTWRKSIIRTIRSSEGRLSSVFAFSSFILHP